MKGVLASVVGLGLIIWCATGELSQWSLVIVAAVAWLLGVAVGCGIR
jgi:hydrogenase/urease accessory protein HupE